MRGSAPFFLARPGEGTSAWERIGYRQLRIPPEANRCSARNCGQGLPGGLTIVQPLRRRTPRVRLPPAPHQRTGHRLPGPRHRRRLPPSHPPRRPHPRDRCLQAFSHQKDELTGSGMAIAGICVSAVMLIPATGIMAAMLFPVFARARETGPQDPVFVEHEERLLGALLVRLGLGRYVPDPGRPVEDTLQPYAKSPKATFICPDYPQGRSGYAFDGRAGRPESGRGGRPGQPDYALRERPGLERPRRPGTLPGPFPPPARG